ncbi:hypothetical protein TanjilG_22023 [Lupinus angustifolius]|uniref:GYF domain-containing protein n=1 Tax=Lupinus angustifolius TaxID=3871 RepID=A0A4P1QTP0_LUPAN|nr:PREDICTED: zinc finger CCCH domain-containing protein 44-like [Lupinus angustifolius]OIV94826.1 hypothetical protein TanjilG_22023 [Lupinus angustifolius]
MEQPLVTQGAAMDFKEKSQFVALARDADVADKEGGGSSSSSVLNKKRGSKTTSRSRPKKKKEEDEDVCFICFDGGSLVLCDRRGCPKAYHPACIKRDEAFFRSKAKWNCGWHICSVCQKASHHMCYTCTYSLCKGCSKTADFVSVRGNKGFCGICMKTIMLIENNALGNNAKCEVDFDDTSSWEYLFKVYWTSLKGNLSLTFDELLQATNSWRHASLSCKVGTPRELYLFKDDKGSGSEKSCIDIESDNLNNKKPKRGDDHIHVGDCVLNDVGCRALIGGVCTHKKPIDPNDASIGDTTNIGVVRSEAPGVTLDMSSLLLSRGIEKPLTDCVNDKLWHYQDPAGKVQGPFSMVQLYKWKASGHFPSDLRIWRIDEKQDYSILLTDALDGKCSKSVLLPHNSQLLSLGPNVTFDNKDNTQGNATRKEIDADSRDIKQSGEQKVDDTCTQSNGKDESVRSNGWNSYSSTPTEGINNEGQSGNFERRDESSKYEISCHNQPHVYPSLPSIAFFENLNENPLDKLREGHGIEANPEDNGNHDLNRTSGGQSNSGQSYQKQSDGEENSGQSSGQNWKCPQAINPVCNASTWLTIFGGPTDCDDSVSDLLAEVEAMESRGGGIESSTSIMKGGEELTDSSKTDFLSFVDGFSTVFDARKGDALSSTDDLHLPFQPTAAAEPFRQTEVSSKNIWGDFLKKF